MNVPEVVRHMESMGINVWLDGNKVRLRYSNGEQRQNLVAQISFLRVRRADVATFLRLRNGDIPVMPTGIRLVAWEPKQPPVRLESFLVVTNSVGFANSALREIYERLSNPKRKYGRSVKQLIEHLAKVGVMVELDPQIQKESF
jgi:hypothetical protein